MTEFGRSLRQLRKDKGLSIRKLSELSGVAHSYLSQVETGKRGTPKVETLERIAAGLDIPSFDLLVQAGYIDPIDVIKVENEKEDREWSITIQKEESIDLDFLLDSDHPLYFQDRLLTKEEKAKVQSIIEIILKD